MSDDEAVSFTPGTAQEADVIDMARYADAEDMAMLRAVLDIKPHFVNAADAKGRTPMHMAAANGHAAVVEELVRRGAARDAANCDGNTALHYAADRNHVDCARALVAAGWSVGAVNALGRTPLQEIADRPYEDMELLLLKNDGAVDEYKAPGATMDIADAEAAEGPEAAEGADDDVGSPTPVDAAGLPPAAEPTVGMDDIE